jgi:hypothetical protein
MVDDWVAHFNKVVGRTAVCRRVGGFVYGVFTRARACARLRSRRDVELDLEVVRQYCAKSLCLYV